MPIHIFDDTDNNIRVVEPDHTSGDAADLTYTISGLDNAGGMAFDGTNLHFADNADDNIRVIAPPTTTGAQTVLRTYTISGVNNPRAMTFDGTNLHVWDDQDNNFRVIAVPTSGGAQTVIRTYTVTGVTSAGGMAFDGTNLHIADNSSNSVSVIAIPTADGVQTALRTYNISGFPGGAAMTFDGTNLHVWDNADDHIITIAVPTTTGTQTALSTYEVDGLDNASAMTFVPGNATYTLSTTDTDIRAGETGVEINVVSDVDVTGLAQADFSITNGTITGFSITDAQNAVLTVTAGSAGTMTVTIAEDAGEPGNDATSEDFTVNAVATYTLSTTDTDIRAGESVDINVVSDIDVSGLTQADFSITGGAITGFSVTDARNAVLTVTAGAGGTMTVTIAADAGSPGNAETSQDFTVNAQAIYTLTTTDSDIREGESVTIDVTATTSVTGLAQDDFTITGGTITGLTGTGTDYALAVTAGAAGTMRITLAADAGTPGNAAVSEDFTINAIRMLHIADGSDDNIRVIRHDTGSGATAQPVRTYEVTGADDMQSIVFDGTHIHVTNWQESTVIVFSPSGANGRTLTPVRSYTVSGISQPSGMAFDGTNIHISDRQDDNIRVIAPDTADGATATIIRTYTVDGLGDCRGMAFDGTNLHAADYSDDNIRVFAPGHTSGDTADLTYTVAGLNHCRAMAFDGVNLHLFDVNDSNIRVIAVPTTGGAQTILRTYNAQSAELVRGMTSTPMPITIHTSDDDIREGESVNFEINADLDITGLTLSDITITGATAISLASVTARRYQLQATAGAGAGEITISIPANAVVPGNLASSATFTRSARATATITFANSDLVSSQQTLATITFSEAITSFDRSDLSLSAGTLGTTLTEVSPTVYRIAVTAPATGSGTMTLSLPQDSTIPENELATGHIDYVESTAITATITMPANLRGGRTADATVVWSESVDDFDAADVSVDVGTIGTITGSGTTYTIPITAPTTPASGSITLTIREDAVSQGNDETTQVVAYSALPTVAMTTTTTNIRAGHIFVVRFEWSETVTGFTTGDVAVTNATKMNFVAVDGDSYTMALRATAAGDIVVTVAEDAVNELNDEAPETFTVLAVPTVAITFDETELETGGTTTVSMRWSETPTGFTATDVIVSAGTLTDFAVDGTDDTLYTATLTAPATGSGTITVTIPTDSIDEFNAFTQASIDYAPPLVATTLEIVSGNNQSAQVGNALTAPLVVRVLDQNSDPFAGATVAFSVLPADGSLSETSVTTDADGQASTVLTLGNTVGDYTVTASVTGLTDVTFTATASAVPLVATTLEIVSGNNQSAIIGMALANPLVVQVLDQNGNIFAGADVTFSTTGGTLSETSVTTGANGQASTSLTLPATEGDYTVTAAVSGLTSVTFTATADPIPPLTFGSETIANQAWVVGTAVNLTLPAATGGTGTITYSLSPATPAGVSFTAATRILAGNPTGRFTSAQFTYTATDGNNTTVELTFTIVVTAAAITFASTIANQAWVVGTAVDLTLPTASGGAGTITYSLSPTTPAGVDFTAATRVLAGTPTGRFTSATFTYTATDAEGITQTQTFTIVVTADAITFASTIANQAWVVGTGVNLTLPTASGGVGPFMYSLSPTLPTNVTFTAATRLLAGTPSAAFASDTFTYTATDAEGITQTQTFTIVVTAPLTFGTATIANQVWGTGTPVNLTLPAATGGVGAITYSLSPTLPAGVMFTAATRVLAGTPTTLFAAAMFTYTATDSAGTNVELTFTIVVTSAHVVTQSLPDALTLYKEALNRSTTPAAAGDNDYSTWTTNTSITIDIRDAAGNPQTFDTIFAKVSGVDNYVVTVDTTDLGIRIVPDNIQITDAFPAIADVSITRDGWQHDMIEISPQTGSSVNLVFTGTNVRVCEVLVLKKSIIVNDNFLSITHEKVDIDSVLQESEEGDEKREIIVGRDRLRWMSNCALEFTFDDDNYETFLDWIEDHPNLVVAQDPQLYPWRVYRAVFPDLQHNAPYICSVIEVGNVVRFRLLENRVIGSDLAVTPKASFNSEDSQDQYLFFNDCRHLDNDRVTKTDGSLDFTPSDNNFATYSQQTTLEFDISNGTDPTDVTHVWLKGDGVTSYQVQTLVSSTWTTQETVTPTQETYRDWDNSLEKLTTAIRATSIRLVFAGTNVRISEVMLLEHAGGLVSLTEVMPRKVDKTGIVQQLQSGEVGRVKTEQRSRFRWQLDFAAVFGHGNTHVLEDFLDWINDNPNFVFAERPEDTPWRTYPAGFLNSGFNASYITQTIQIGELVQCQLSER